MFWKNPLQNYIDRAVLIYAHAEVHTIDNKRWMQLLITGTRVHAFLTIIDCALSFFITCPTKRHLHASFEMIDYPLILLLHSLQKRHVHALFETFHYPLFVSVDFHIGQFDS